MWLVMQVGPYDQGIIFVVVRQHLPIGDPARLWIGGGIPERGLRAVVRAMVVENDAQANVAGIADNLRLSILEGETG